MTKKAILYHLVEIDEDNDPSRKPKIKQREDDMYGWDIEIEWAGYKITVTEGGIVHIEGFRRNLYVEDGKKDVK